MRRRAGAAHETPLPPTRTATIGSPTRTALRLAVCAALLAGGAARASQDVGDAGAAPQGSAQRVRVGIFDFEPLVSGDRAGRPRGLYVDLLERVAREEGWTLEYVHGTWDDCWKALADERVDLVPTVGWSEERARRFAFGTEFPVLDWGVVFTRRGSPVESVFDLRGRRVGVLRGSIYTQGFRALLEQFRIEAQLVDEDDYRAVFDAVRRGELDAGIDTQVAGAAIAEEYGLRPTRIYFSPVRLGFAAPPARRALLAALDAHLVAWKADPSSEWNELFARWMPGRAAARAPRWLLPVLASAAALLLVSAAFAWVLRRQVAARTVALRRANARLRESEALLRTFSDAIPDPIFLKDGDGRWRFANPAVLGVLGKPLDAVLGHTDEEIYADRAVAARLTETDRRIMASGAVEVIEETIQTPSGHRTYLTTKVPWRDADGRVSGIIGSARDVTEQRHTEEQLRQAQKLESIGRLAGGVAHDFNNLLTVILSCATNLEEDVRGGAPASLEDVEAIRGAGQRAAELTRQLLAFARKQVIAPVALDLNAVVRGSEKLLRRVLGEDVELAVSLEPGLWSVRCDPGQLEQVILNLAVNARDAMPGGGRLELETANARAPSGAAPPGVPPGDYVRLVIRDGGTGMSPDVKAHLFEPFFTTKAQGKGTGLGLATVYGIVKQSDGHLAVESEPGRGTTIEVWLPRTREEAAAVAGCAAAPERRGSERLLVVEDDPQVREVTVRSLRGGGYDVVVAATGREALALGDDDVGRLQLLVTDVVMPGLDGRALAGELVRRHPALRVLYVSGHPQDAIADRGVLEPGVELLPKPFTPAALLSRVRAVLDAR